MLLADLHIHTTWSDGSLSIAEVVDLFGHSGHDVIAITDHVVNRDNLVGKVTHRLGLSVNAQNFDAYRSEIEWEARRAWDQYRMLLLAGAELTQNRIRRSASAHALALGLDHFIPAEGSVEEMITRAHDAKAIVVACHPNEQSDWFANTFYLWNRRREVSGLIDLWEVACRWDLFPRVSRAKLRFIGNSDFHQPKHLYAWKTLLPCEKRVNDVLRTLKSGTGFALTRLQPQPSFEGLPTLSCA